MYDDAKNVYEERLRLIEEDEACAVKAAHLSAALKRIAAQRWYIHEQEKELLASSQQSDKMKRTVQPQSGNHETPSIHITNNLTTSANASNAPTYNQHGDGGQYVAEQMFMVPDVI